MGGPRVSTERMIRRGKLCSQCRCFLPRIEGTEPRERLCAACIRNGQADVPKCELCEVALEGSLRSHSPWCDECERTQLITVSVCLSKEKDTWAAKFLDSARQESIAKERRFHWTRGLFTMVAKSYDPGGVLDRLAYILYKTETGSLDMRLTREQHAKLCGTKDRRAE